MAETKTINGGEATKEEIEKYRALTGFQKSVVDALKIKGFTHKYFFKWECNGFLPVDVSRFHSIGDVITHFHEDGKDQKRFEIINALGL